MICVTMVQQTCTTCVGSVGVGEDDSRTATSTASSVTGIGELDVSTIITEGSGATDSNETYSESTTQSAKRQNSSNPHTTDMTKRQKISVLGTSSTDNCVNNGMSFTPPRRQLPRRICRLGDVNPVHYKEDTNITVPSFSIFIIIYQLRPQPSGTTTPRQPPSLGGSHRRII